MSQNLRQKVAALEKETISITAATASAATIMDIFEATANGTNKISLTGPTSLAANLTADIGLITPGASGKLVNVTAATLAVTAAAHAGRIVTLNRAGGIVVTMPEAAGTGDVYTFIVGTTFTSDATIKVAALTDEIMVGLARLDTDAADGSAPGSWRSAATTDTITLDGSTTGGIKGDIVQLIDIATDTWLVYVNGRATGTEATPFSATVSS